MNLSQGSSMTLGASSRKKTYKSHAGATKHATTTASPSHRAGQLLERGDRCDAAPSQLTAGRSRSVASVTAETYGRRRAAPSPGLPAALRRALGRLFVDTRGFAPRLSMRVTTISATTPEPLLRALENHGLVIVEAAPRIRLVFGVPGWTCALTSAGRAALRSTLRQEVR